MTDGSGEIITIRHGDSGVSISPAAGGSITRYWQDTAGGTIEWLRPASPEAIDEGRREARGGGIERAQVEQQELLGDPRLLVGERPVGAASGEQRTHVGEDGEDLLFAAQQVRIVGWQLGTQRAPAFDEEPRIAGVHVEAQHQAPQTLEVVSTARASLGLRPGSGQRWSVARAGGGSGLTPCCAGSTRPCSGRSSP